MRIVSEWNYKQLKVTVFHYNEKFSLKLETDLMEQIYKFRDGQINSLADIKSKIGDAFYEDALESFAKMKLDRDKLFVETEEDFEFDEII